MRSPVPAATTDVGEGSSPPPPTTPAPDRSEPVPPPSVRLSDLAGLRTARCAMRRDPPWRALAEGWLRRRAPSPFKTRGTGELGQPAAGRPPSSSGGKDDFIRSSWVGAEPAGDSEPVCWRRRPGAAPSPVPLTVWQPLLIGASVGYQPYPRGSRCRFGGCLLALTEPHSIGPMCGKARGIRYRRAHCGMGGRPKADGSTRTS